MENARRKEVWASGDAYEPYVGRWSRHAAREFLTWLSVPSKKRWLDVGCGTGALSQTILQFASPAAVTGIDPSEGYVAYARKHVTDDRVRFEVGDAQALPYPTAIYDAAVAGLVLNFVPQPSRAIAEMARVVSLGGTVAAYVWDYADKMQLMRYFWDAAIALDPKALELDEGKRFPLCHPEPLKKLFQEAGLQNVEV
ncbi:methyltransferase domain-containing protein, partial [Candidatus Acetothermia bacterium]|nr:methyltransferase domain-containing protein [Candidatus Acetothermia bacterium]